MLFVYWLFGFFLFFNLRTLTIHLY